MTLPQSFEEELLAQFQGRFRLRWSPKRQRWQLEEKRARAIMLDRPISSIDDEGIREKEGFTLLCEVSPGTTHKCDRCARPMKLAVNRMKTSRCQHCRKEHKLFYWYPGPDLLLHLRKIDPYNGGIDRVFVETDFLSEKFEKSRKRDGRNYREAVGKNDFNYIHEIQSVGYTGRSSRFYHRDKGLK